MRNKILLIIFTIVFFKLSYSQTINIGAKFSINTDKYEFTDPGRKLKGIPVPSSSYGLIFSKELKNQIIFETGVSYKVYNEGYSYTSNTFSKWSGIGASESFHALLIPLVIKSRINLKKEKFWLMPRIGVNYAINTDFGNGLGYGASMLIVDSNSIMVNYIEDIDITPSFILLETGFELGFRISKSFNLVFMANYFHGFKKVSQFTYEYSINSSSIQKAFAHSNGDFWNFAFGIKYQISDS